MFYQSIAPFYDYIFPKNPQQVKFLEFIETISNHECILDIGCATGNLTSLVYEKTQNVIGIDLDEDLLKIAKDKNPHMTFLYKNMLDLETFQKESFNRVISFGNTLVHLESPQAVKVFFQKVYNVLKPGGFFSLQIINYDYIYNHNIRELPLIDNDVLRFERYYDLYEDHVDFKTNLFIKANRQTIKNSIALLNLKRSFLEASLKEIGFKDLSFYGNFKGQPLEETSLPLIFNCKK